MKKTVMMFALMTVAGAVMASDRNFVAPSADEVRATVQADMVARSKSEVTLPSNNAFILGHETPHHSNR